MELEHKTALGRINRFFSRNRRLVLCGETLTMVERLDWSTPYSW